MMYAAYQRSKIRRSLKKVRDPVIRDRLRIVQRYYEQGTFRKAAKEAGCGHMKVKYWRDRYEAGGVRGLSSPEKRGGRPRKLKEKAEKRLKTEITERTGRESWQTAQIREYIREQSGVTYSKRQTIRIAQRWGLAMIMLRPRYAHSQESERAAFLKEEQENH